MNKKRIRAIKRAVIVIAGVALVVAFGLLFRDMMLNPDYYITTM